MMTALLLSLAAAASAQSLPERVERDYVRPALEQVRGAFDGREPSWVPPVMPGMPQTRALSQDVCSRWLEPLLQSNEGFVRSAAHSLGSERLGGEPAEPDLGPPFSSRSLSPAAASLVEAVDRRFLQRLFDPGYLGRAAQSLGSGDPGAGAPDEPSVDDLSEPGDLGLGEPAGSPQAEASAKPAEPALPAKDSTQLVRGRSAAPRPRLKPAPSRFSHGK